MRFFLCPCHNVLFIRSTTDWMTILYRKNVPIYWAFYAGIFSPINYCVLGCPYWQSFVLQYPYWPHISRVHVIECGRKKMCLYPKNQHFVIALLGSGWVHSRQSTTISSRSCVPPGILRMPWFMPSIVTVSFCTIFFRIWILRPPFFFEGKYKLIFPPRPVRYSSFPAHLESHNGNAARRSLQAVFSFAPGMLTHDLAFM